MIGLYSSYRFSEIKLAMEPDEDVERIRRAHRNDIEVVFNFLIVTFFAITSGSESENILNCLRVYTVARYLHTICYVNAIRQPFRAICNGICTILHYGMILITFRRFIFVN